jgi:hypothetical protein
MLASRAGEVKAGVGGQVVRSLQEFDAAGGVVPSSG